MSSLFFWGYLDAINSTEEETIKGRVFHPDAIFAIKKSAEKFLEEAMKLCPEIDWTDISIVTHAAHDFWFTRNGHGAGFWDGDWPPVIDTKLTTLAHSMGEQYVYVGDDGLVYVQENNSNETH